VVTLPVPPLRDRIDDIALLIDYFMVQFSKEMGIDNPGINKDTKVLLSSRAWPGNVRELGNTIQKALIFSRGAPIAVEDIPQVADSPVVWGDNDLNEVLRNWLRKKLTSGIRKHLFNELMDQFGQILIGEALKLTGNNRTRAAKILDISRPTLLSKIEKYGLKVETSVKK